MPVPGQVTQVLPHRPGITQVVVGLHQPPKQPGLCRRGHGRNPNRRQLTQPAGNGRLLDHRGHRPTIPISIVGGVSRWRQCDAAPQSQLAQQRPGRHVFVHAPGVGPIPVATQLLRQPGSMPIGARGNQLTDEPEVLRGDNAALNNGV